MKAGKTICGACGQEIKPLERHPMPSTAAFALQVVSQFMTGLGMLIFLIVTLAWVFG